MTVDVQKGTQEKAADDKRKKNIAQAKSKVGDESINLIFLGVNASKKKGKLATATQREQTAKKSTTQSKGSIHPKNDRVYHKPQETVQLSDVEFFSPNSVSPAIIPNKFQTEIQNREGVDSIVSVKQLQKMLSRDRKAGTTVNCPFDCNCCF